MLQEERMNVTRTGPVVVGVDVGSTTVKAVVLDPSTREMLWSDYQRHQTRQPENCLLYTSPSLRD